MPEKPPMPEKALPPGDNGEKTPHAAESGAQFDSGKEEAQSITEKVDKISGLVNDLKFKDIPKIERPEITAPPPPIDIGPAPEVPPALPKQSAEGNGTESDAATEAPKTFKFGDKLKSIKDGISDAIQNDYLPNMPNLPMGAKAMDRPLPKTDMGPKTESSPEATPPSLGSRAKSRIDAMKKKISDTINSDELPRMPNLPTGAKGMDRPPSKNETAAPEAGPQKKSGNTTMRPGSVLGLNPDDRPELGNFENRYPVGYARRPSGGGSPPEGPPPRGPGGSESNGGGEEPPNNWRGFEEYHILGSNAENFYNRMSTQGKGLFRTMYEYGYRVPGISRVMAGISIAYNRLFMRRHERKAAKWKNRLDAKNLIIKNFDDQKKQISAQIEVLRKNNTPGAASLQIALQNIERRQAKLRGKTDKYQTKFEKRDNKIKKYVDRRDAIADRMISRYETKLKPIEQQLDSIKLQQDHLKLDESVMKLRHKDEEARLDNLAKTRAQIIELNGKWRSKFTGEVRELDRMMAEGQRRLQEERDSFARRKAKIDDYIAKLDKAANPYRDKRDRFVRAKQDRSIDFGVLPRTREQNPASRVWAEVHSRLDAISSPLRPAAPEGAPAAERKEGEPVNVGDFVLAWEKFLKKKYDDKVEPARKIVLSDFLSKTGLDINYALTKEGFVAVLHDYFAYRYHLDGKKFPEEIFNQDGAEFLNPKEEKPKEEPKKKDKGKKEKKEPEPKSEAKLSPENLEALKKNLTDEKARLEGIIQRIANEAGLSPEEKEKRQKGPKKQLDKTNALLKMFEAKAPEEEEDEEEDETENEGGEKDEKGEGEGGDKDK